MHNAEDKWQQQVKDFQLVAPETDRVLVDAPQGSYAAKYNGQDGYITGFGDGWIIANVDGLARRFRPDELKVL